MRSEMKERKEKKRMEKELRIYDFYHAQAQKKHITA